MFTLRQVEDAFRTATHAYDIHGSGQGYVAQTDLLPVSVLAADHLLGTLAAVGRARPFICAAAMGRNADRQWVASNLLNATHYPYENMVDVCAMRGASDPYEVVLTMESEGWGQNGAHLAKKGATDNAALWDLYKLLQVPSPARIFVTRMADRHHEGLLAATAHLARVYEQAVTPGDLFAVQIPSASLKTASALVAHWMPGAWSAPPSTTRVRLV